jgi:hypothetical protein
VSLVPVIVQQTAADRLAEGDDEETLAGCIGAVHLDRELDIFDCEMTSDTWDVAAMFLQVAEATGAADVLDGDTQVFIAAHFLIQPSEGNCY